MPTVIKKEGTTALVGRVVTKLRRELLEGTYREGDRLPSFRKLAKVHGVSIFTVHRALAELKKEGLVITREGASTLVGKVNGDFVEQGGSGSDTPEGSGDAPQAVRWMRQDSSLRKLRISILEKTFDSSSARSGRRVIWRDKWMDLPGEAFLHEAFRAFLNDPEPTCAVFNRTHASALDAHHSLADISANLGAGDTVRLQAFLGKLDPEVLDQAAPVRDGKRRVLMLPTSRSLGALLYDRSRLAAAGLPDRAPRTWEEFLHVLVALERANGRPPLTIQDYRSVGWLVAQFCQQVAEAPQSGHALGPINYLAEEISPALDWIIKLMFQKRLIEIPGPGSGEVAFSRLLAGEVPVFLAPSSEAAQLAEFGEAERFLLGSVPTPDGALATNLMNIAGWTVNAHSPAASQRGASAHLLGFISWLHSQEGGAQMKRLAIGRSLFSVFSDPASDGACQRPLPASWLAVIEEAESSARWEPRGASFEYEGVGERLLRLQQAAGTEISASVLREECRMAQRHSAGIDLTALEADAISLAFS